MKGFVDKLAIALACLAGLNASVDAELAGQLAPDFALKSASGSNYRLSEYRGRVVLVSFWATWCGECRSQLTALADMHQRYPDVGLQFFAISVDRDVDDVADAAHRLGIEFPALHDVGGHVSEQYAVDRTPYVVLIDQQGVIRFEHAGFHTGDEREYLEQARLLLNE